MTTDVSRQIQPGKVAFSRNRPHVVAERQASASKVKTIQASALRSSSFGTASNKPWSSKRKVNDEIMEYLVLVTAQMESGEM
jgi:hypothetical protein